MDTENGITMDFLQNDYKPFHLWMMVGFPCSGKSTTVLEEFGGGEDAVVVSTDNYIEAVARKQGLTYNDVFQEVVAEAHTEMDKKLKEYVEDKIPVIIWDQTNLSRKTRAKKLKQFKSIPGSELYTIGSYFINTPYEVCLERNNNRPGKFIPIHIMESMKSQLEIPELDEGFMPMLERHFINLKDLKRA